MACACILCVLCILPCVWHVRRPERPRAAGARPSQHFTFTTHRVALHEDPALALAYQTSLRRTLVSAADEAEAAAHPLGVPIVYLDAHEFAAQLRDHAPPAPPPADGGPQISRVVRARAPRAEAPAPPRTRPRAEPQSPPCGARRPWHHRPLPLGRRCLARSRRARAVRAGAHLP